MGILGCTKKSEPPKPQLSAEDQAIFQCKKCRDNIKSYIKRLDNNSVKQRNQAKEHLKNKNRERAKMCLNQSKFYQTQIESSSNQLAMIEDQIIRIETTRSQKETFAALEQGNKILTELQKEVNIEKWEKISEDMDDLRENQNEIGEFLKSKNINMEEYNEGLDKDLENLMKQEGIILDSNVLPDAKTDEIKTKVIQEDKYVDKELALA